MNIPAASVLRADTRIDWVGRFGLTATPPPDMLDAEIVLAWKVLEELTGQNFEAMGAEWDPVILRALTYFVVYQAASGRGDFAGLVSGVSGIISFSVPGYSETRAQSRSLSGGRDWFFHEWRPLDQLIWALATDEKRAEMTALALGKHRPFIGIAHTEEVVSGFGIERDFLQ